MLLHDVLMISTNELQKLTLYLSVTLVDNFTAISLRMLWDGTDGHSKVYNYYGYDYPVLTSFVKTNGWN